MKIIEQQIIEKLEEANNILIVCHRNPDADTLGAAAAFSSYIKDQLKNLYVFCTDPIPDYLNNFNQILNLSNNITQDYLNKFDLILCLDCGEIKQTGIADLITNRQQQIFVINIDHHFTNDNFGNLNLVDPVASSTSEITYKLFKNQKIKLTKQALDLLLTGIMADTTFFSNGATTQTSLSISSELMSNGADIKTVLKNIWKNKDVNTLKFWGEIFSRLEFNEKYGIAYTIITQDDLRQNKLTEEAIGGMSNFLTNLYQPNIILVLRETEDSKIKGSLRTTKDNIDVSSLAQMLGGGGHKKAAGFTIDGNLKKIGDKWMIS